MVKAITGAQVNALNPPILAKAVLNSCPLPTTQKSHL